VTENGGKVIFELIDGSGSASRNPLIVSVDSDNVSIRTFRVARELIYSTQKVNVRGVVSTAGGAVYLAATMLEKRD
jgi:hypothetical protein